MSCNCIDKIMFPRNFITVFSWSSVLVSRVPGTYVKDTDDIVNGV